MDAGVVAMRIEKSIRGGEVAERRAEGQREPRPKRAGKDH